MSNKDQSIWNLAKVVSENMHERTTITQRKEVAEAFILELKSTALVGDILALFGFYSHAEIASFQGVSESAIMKRRQRAGDAFEKYCIKVESAKVKYYYYAKLEEDYE